MASTTSVTDGSTIEKRVTQDDRSLVYVELRGKLVSHITNVIATVTLLGYTLVWGTVAVLVYRDAVESDGCGRLVALGWAVIVFLLGIFGVIAYKSRDWIGFEKP